MKKVVAICLSIVFAVIVLLCKCDPVVSLAFEPQVDASVEQVVRPDGGFHLVVSPAEAAARFSYVTVAGVPCFPRVWLIAICRSTTPLGSSEIVDFPRFFGLIGKAFHFARFALAFTPLAALLLIWFIRWLVPLVREHDSPSLFRWCLVSVLVLSLPPPVRPALPGLDESWMWFLNHFAFARVFGSDVVFTYGPLGFLLVPELAWGNVFLALFFNLVFCLLFGCLLMRIYRCLPDGRTVAWLLLLTMIFPQGTMEWRWVLLSVLYAAWPVVRHDEERFDERWTFAIAGALVGFLSFVKFSSLIAVCGVQLFCLAALLRQDARKARSLICFYAVSALAVFTIGSFVFFGSWHRMFSWLVGSIETASGYNLHMVAEKTFLELFLPFVVILSFMLVVGWRRTFLFLPVLFCTAKYAWVRQSSVPMLYISSALAFLCLAIRPAVWKRSLIFGVMGLIVSIALGVPWLLSGLSGIECVSGVTPVNAINTVFLPRTMKEMSRQSRCALEEFKIPDDWRGRIGNAGVLCFPWGYEPVIADPTLNLVPLPSLQLYSACHPALDERNAELLSGEKAPRFVIYGLAGGYDVINYPRTWKALLSHYVFSDRNEKYVLLERRSCPRCIPPSVVRYSPERTLLERIVATAFRAKVEYFERTDGRGKMIRHQYVRGNQGVDYPTEWIPFDSEELQDIFR